MLPTHALSGMIISLPLFYFKPELAYIGLISGLIGSVFPDSDMYWGHRKTLHYPVYYSVLAFLSLTAFLIYTTPATLAISFFLIGCTIHTLSDILTAGLELKPWKQQSKKAVYNHYSQEWIEPKHIIAYDGSKGDLAILLSLSIPLLFILGPKSKLFVFTMVIIGIIYSLLRKKLPNIGVQLIEYIPSRYMKYVPNRYIE